MKEDVKLIWVSTPLSICQSRDTKGLYKKAVEGEISNFTGINAQFEVPEEECLVVNAGEESIENCLKKILIYISEFLVPIK
jgi:adenylylsulfate kinase-like enzyme